MSTNYYIRKKMNRQQQDKLVDMIIDRNLEEAKSYLNDEFGKIHLGKRSGGWEFRWNFNAGKYYTSGKELIDVLKSGEYTILDEYDREYSFDAFWNEISDWIKTSEDDDLIDLAYFYDSGMYGGEHKYYEKVETIKEYKEKYNIDVNDYGEFHSDGLRFTTSDFR